MNTLSLRERLKSSYTSATAREELRRRILEIVDRKRALTDMAIWHESAPDYLPWSYMLEEIKTLDREQKLRLEAPAPGHLVVHSLAPKPAELKAPAPKPATKAPRKTSTSKRAKRAKSSPGKTKD